MQTEYNTTEFLQMHTAMQRKEAAKRLAMSEVGIATKRMKDGGLDMAAYKVAVKCAKKDPAEFRAFINAFTTMVQDLRVPGSAQLSLIQLDDPTRAKSDAEYYDQGWLAASLGKERTACVHDATSGPGIHWNQGYDGYLKDISQKQAKENAKLIKANIKEKVDEPVTAVAEAVADVGVGAEAAPDPVEPAPAKPARQRRPKAAVPVEEAAVEADAEAPPPPPELTVGDGGTVLEARPGDSPTQLELMRKRREERLAQKNRIKAAVAS